MGVWARCAWGWGLLASPFGGPPRGRTRRRPEAPGVRSSGLETEGPSGRGGKHRHLPNVRGLPSPRCLKIWLKEGVGRGGPNSEEGHEPESVISQWRRVEDKVARRALACTVSVAAPAGPTAVESTALRESCGIVARHLYRKVIPGVPGELRSCPTVPPKLLHDPSFVRSSTSSG